MVRICTGEVCVRSRRPPARKKVSWLSRAGWSGGKLSASKLCQSSSASGPSATEYPMRRKISSISRRTSVTGWQRADPGRRPGSVTSSACRRWLAASASACAAARRSSTSFFSSLSALPYAGLASRGSDLSASSRSRSRPERRPAKRTRTASTRAASRPAPASAARNSSRARSRGSVAIRRPAWPPGSSWRSWRARRSPRCRAPPGRRAPCGRARTPPPSARRSAASTRSRTAAPPR